MNDTIQREHEELIEVEKELDNPIIDRDPKRKKELETRKQELGAKLDSASERLSIETQKILDRLQPCEVTSVECKAGQKCFDAQGEPYTEKGCNTLRQIGDRRGCAWTGNACEVGGLNKYATTEDTTKALNQVLTKMPSLVPINRCGTTGIRAFNNSPTINPTINHTINLCMHTHLVNEGGHRCALWVEKHQLDQT